MITITAADLAYELTNHEITDGIIHVHHTTGWVLAHAVTEHNTNDQHRVFHVLNEDNELTEIHTWYTAPDFTVEGTDQVAEADAELAERLDGLTLNATVAGQIGVIHADTNRTLYFTANTGRAHWTPTPSLHSINTSHGGIQVHAHQVTVDWKSAYRLTA